MQCDDVIPSNSTRILLALPSWKLCLWNYGRLLSKEKMATGCYTLRHKDIVVERVREKDRNGGTGRQTVFQLKSRNLSSGTELTVHFLFWAFDFCLYVKNDILAILCILSILTLLREHFSLKCLEYVLTTRPGIPKLFCFGCYFCFIYLSFSR